MTRTFCSSRGDAGIRVASVHVLIGVMFSSTKSLSLLYSVGNSNRHSVSISTGGTFESSSDGGTLSVCNSAELISLSSSVLLPAPLVPCSSGVLPELDRRCLAFLDFFPLISTKETTSAPRTMAAAIAMTAQTQPATLFEPEWLAPVGDKGVVLRVP